LKPDIAESWSVSPDGLTLTFKLRTGVVFHDGSPLTSKDVQATFDRIRNPPAGIVSIRKELFADITSIETPDLATVVMKIKEPDASFLGSLALPYNCIYSAAKLPRTRISRQDGDGQRHRVREHRTVSAGWASASTGTGRKASLPRRLPRRLHQVAGGVMALQGGQIQAEFRSISPGERAQLVNALKDKITVQEAPWVCKIELCSTPSQAFDNPKDPAGVVDG
jgi:peptide/nickel transport system substrate-binding protein